MELIQKMMLRPESIETAEKMYFSGRDYCYLRDRRAILVKKNGMIDTGTYFNAFSIYKWRKYTDICSLVLHVKCKGIFTLVVTNHWLTAGDYLEECLYERYFEEEENEINIDLTPYLDREGIIYFKIEAHSDCVISTADYRTMQEIGKKRIALAVCTYKREAYIHRLVRAYSTYEGADHLGIFIADNGNNLPDMKNGNIHVFPNKNAGGSAGFARCMLEVSCFNENSGNPYDYIVLMDDDITIDFQMMDRMTMFVSMLREEYHSHVIAGAMCSADYPFIQYEKYSSWRGNACVQFGADSDLRDRNTVIRNERIEHFENELAGWWFCCFSTHLTGANNYPFPCFFRGDDMEFSLRNRIDIITLNGICVWHEPFYKKYSIVSEYYYLIRNTLVLNALYMSHITKKDQIRYLYSKIKCCLLKYDYTTAELVIKAGYDYLKGTDFFKYTDAEKLNKELLSCNHKMVSLEQLCAEYRFEDIEREIYDIRDKNRLQMFLRRCTINGFLIPTFCYKTFGFALVGFGAKNINFYKVKRVLNFDPFSKKGYFLEVDKKHMLKIICQFIVLGRKICKYNEKVKKDYQIHLKETYTRTFWENYLNL